MTRAAPPHRPLALAFLGCGFATRLHSRTLAGFRREARCYYASRDPGKADAFNRRFHGHGAFGSYAAAIEHPAVDVVLIATPPATHLELAIRALRAGKDVVVEKPPFLRSTDFATIRRLQDETGRRVFVAENYFYKPLAAVLQRVLRAGWIGEVLFVHVNALKSQPTRDWRDDLRLAGGGALFEGGIHWINLLSNLGLAVTAACGFQPACTPARGVGADRSMVVVVRYAEGAVGTLYYSWEVPSLFRGLRLSKIFGRGGSVTFESNGLFVIVRGARTRFIVPSVTDAAGYRAMFRDFFRALRRREEPAMTLDLAERDLRLAEAIYASLRA